MNISFWHRLIGAVVLPGACLLAALPAHALDSRDYFSAPNGWSELSFKKDPNREETRYVPEGEDSANWSQMITLIKLNSTREEAMQSLLDKTLRTAMLRCNEPPLTRGRYRDNQGMVNGYIAETACDKVNIKSGVNGTRLQKMELLRLFIVQRSDGIFMITYNWHHDRISAKKRFDDPAQLNSFSSLISELR